MLSNQAVSPLVFHIILFLSFTQILFNIFYKVNVYTEFTENIQMIQNGKNGTNQTETMQNIGVDYKSNKS
jgi:hypothetical protein